MAEEVFEVINEKAFVSSEYPLIIVVRKKVQTSVSSILIQILLHKYYTCTFGLVLG